MDKRAVNRTPKDTKEVLNRTVTRLLLPWFVNVWELIIMVLENEIKWKPKFLGFNLTLWWCDSDIIADICYFPNANH